MKATLENLWNGKIAPCKNCGTDDPEIGNLNALIERNIDKLNCELSQQQKIVFENLMGCLEEYLYLTSMNAFCEGFSLSSKLLAEALV